MEKIVRFKKRMKTKQAATLLEQMSHSLQNGLMVVEKGSEFVVLTPQPFAKMELKTSQKKDKGKIEFELSWKISETERPKERLKKPLLETNAKKPKVVQKLFAQTPEESVETTEAEEEADGEGEEFISIRFEQ